MCRELEERQTEQNINLGFVDFCNKTSTDNFNKFIKIGYITTQYKALTQGKLLPDEQAINIATQLALQYKMLGCMDILNRQDKFVFNED